MDGIDGNDVGWIDVVADPTRLHIIRTLSELHSASAVELAGDGRSYHTFRRHLDALVACGVVSECPGVSDGKTRGRPPLRFTLNPQVRDSIVSTLYPSARKP
jgi:predicted ArsR family transcriptional regulator